MKKLIRFIRNETVLSISLILALLSSLIVHPDREYLTYVDVRTLAILFCLMAVMAGLQSLGVFRLVAGKLIGRVKRPGELVLILIMLCFFFSMVITNDVALITFVPFTFTVLRLLGEEQADRLVIPTVVMQTVAANLGSMFTPIGNPQNLYLFGLSGMGTGQFLMLMLPYTLLSLFLLVIWCVRQGYQFGRMSDCGNCKYSLSGLKAQEQVSLKGNGRKLVLYALLFLLSLLTVAQIVPYQLTLVLVVSGIIILDRRILGSVDYSLLVTFVGFFIFIGNMGRIPAFRSFLEKIISGHETLTGIAASQVISNVPAALLLSGFTRDIKALIVGTNLGGLGTLIASMASLISFKYIGREKKSLRGPYLLYFTVANVCFLVALTVMFVVIC